MSSTTIRLVKTLGGQLIGGGVWYLADPTFVTGNIGWFIAAGIMLLMLAYYWERLKAVGDREKAVSEREAALPSASPSGLAEAPQGTRMGAVHVQAEQSRRPHDAEIVRTLHTLHDLFDFLQGPMTAYRDMIGRTLSALGKSPDASLTEYNSMHASVANAIGAFSQSRRMELERAKIDLATLGGRASSAYQQLLQYQEFVSRLPEAARIQSVISKGTSDAIHAMHALNEEVSRVEAAIRTARADLGGI